LISDPVSFTKEGGEKMHGKSVSDDRSGSNASPPGEKAQTSTDFDDAAALKMLEMIFDFAPAGILVSGALGDILWANKAAERLAQVRAKGMALSLGPEIWGKMFDLRGHLVPGEQWPPMRAMHGETTTGKECRMVHKDGTSYHLLFGAAPIAMGNHTILGVIATLSDITRQKREEATSRKEAVARERQRMAADIHDTVAQSLSAIVLHLEAATQRLPNKLDRTKRHITRAQEVARQCLSDARESMWTFAQDRSTNADLAESLSSWAKLLFAGSAVKLTFYMQEEPAGLSSRLRNEMLRIAKEALLNSWRHGKSTKVDIEVAYGSQSARLIITDNGIGFVLGISNKPDGFGLTSMRERTKTLGGKILFQSSPGRGTKVTCVIPFLQSAVVA
jgi:signal transduction histidine kinase